MKTVFVYIMSATTFAASLGLGAAIASDLPLRAGTVHDPRPSSVASPNLAGPTMIPESTTCQQSLEAAKTAFKLGDFDTALSRVNRGLEQCPGTRVLHEFRALVLFAKGDYRASSAAVHTVMATGSNWNWGTLVRLYPDVDAYTAQLRALEEFTRKHPDDGPARFLQAYHYMVVGYPDAAARELEMVIRLESNDAIAAELLKRLSRPATLGVPGSYSYGTSIGSP